MVHTHSKLLLTLLPIFISLQPTIAGYGQTIRDQDGLESGGERFRQDAYYKRLIVAHAVFAVLTFLVVIPLAVISARYTKHLQSKGWWWKNHAILNGIAVVFVTIVFTLGYYAVGTQGNTFDNVHHRIGLTIFIAILLQFLLGLLNFLVLSKPHVRTPIQNRLHILLGWLTWGLALAQIPVGMILYGSPRWAYGLYGAAAGLVALVILAFEIRIGRREDHNVDLRGYRHMGEAHALEGAPPGAVPAYTKVNWNGEIVGEKRKMFRL